MDDDNISSSFSIAFEAACSIGSAVLLLAVTAACLRSAFRVILVGSYAALQLCRRWGLIASAVASAWYVFAMCVHAEPQLLIVVAIAAVDCWLITFLWPRTRLPRATARKRSRRGAQLCIKAKVAASQAMGLSVLNRPAARKEAVR